MAEDLAKLSFQWDSNPRLSRLATTALNPRIILVKFLSKLSSTLHTV